MTFIFIFPKEAIKFYPLPSFSRYNNVEPFTVTHLEPQFTKWIMLWNQIRDNGTGDYGWSNLRRHTRPAL
jgi:hypothetical protein